MNFEIAKEILRARRICLLLLSLLIFLNLGIYVFNHYVRHPELEKARRDWTALRQKRTGTGQQQAAAYAESIVDLRVFRDAIPLKKNLPEVLGELFQIVADNGLRTSTVEYRPALLEDQRLWAYAVTMKVAGPYESLKFLINDIQRTEQMLVVDNLRFNADDQKDYVTLDMALTFYLKEDDTP